MKTSELLGKKIKIKSVNEWEAIKTLCAEHGIEVGTWFGCEYNQNKIGVAISHDYGTKYSKKLIAMPSDYWDYEEDNMLEFCDLTEIDIETLDIADTNSQYNHRQTIQNFLNCCIMETQGKPVTHEELASLLDFYFSEDDYWKGVSNVN